MAEVINHELSSPVALPGAGAHPAPAADWEWLAEMYHEERARRYDMEDRNQKLRSLITMTIASLDAAYPTVAGYYQRALAEIEAGR